MHGYSARSKRYKYVDSYSHYGLLADWNVAGTGPQSGNSYDGVDVKDTGKIYHLNPIGQGSGESQRIGTQLWIKNLYMRYNMALTPGVDPSAPVTARIIIFMDKQANKVLPLPAQVLQTVGDASLLKISSFSPLNDDQRYRFKVLHDSTHYLTGKAPSANNKTMNGGKIILKLNEPVTYEGAPSGYQNIVTGGLYVLAISDTSDGGVLFNYQTRVRFADANR